MRGDFDLRYTIFESKENEASRNLLIQNIFIDVSPLVSQGTPRDDSGLQFFTIIILFIQPIPLCPHGIPLYHFIPEHSSNNTRKVP